MEAMELLCVILLAVIIVVGMFIGGGIYVIKLIARGIKWLFSKKS